MNYAQKEIQSLLFRNEVLRARLEIRDFFLKTTVKEVYENIGQVLSLVRMQLAFLSPKKEETATMSIAASGDLVGQSIRDLRTMCRSFYPDMDILQTKGFVEGLENTIRILELPGDTRVKVKGHPVELIADLTLFTFKLLQDVLLSIRDINGTLAGVTLLFDEGSIQFIATYRGGEITANLQNTNAETSNLSFEKRTQLIEATYYEKTNKHGLTKLVIQVPKNPTIYEND